MCIQPAFLQILMWLNSVVHSTQYVNLKRDSYAVYKELKCKWVTRSYKRQRNCITHCLLFYDNLCRFLGMFPSVISGRRAVLSRGPPLTTLITATPTVRSGTCVPTRYLRTVLDPSGVVTITWGHIKGKIFHSGQNHKKLEPFVMSYGALTKIPEKITLKYPNLHYKETYTDESCTLNTN